PLICAFLLSSNATATTEIYTLSLHDALPISAAGNGPHAVETLRLAGSRKRLHRRRGRSPARPVPPGEQHEAAAAGPHHRTPTRGDRKSTRLNSSHVAISYAVFCLKKKMEEVI